MMKRKTTNPTKWIKMLFVLPVLAAMVYIFSEKVTAQAEVEKESGVGVKKAESLKENEIQIHIRADGKIEVDGQIIEVGQLTELIDSGNNEKMTARISAYPGVKMGFVADVQKVLRDKDIRRVVYQSQLSKEKGSIIYPIPTSPEYRQTTLAEFKKLNGVYLVEKNRGGLFKNKTALEIEDLYKVYSSLQEQYAALSYEDKRIIQRPSFPYVKLEKDGKMVFKKFEELTEEERKTLAC